VKYARAAGDVSGTTAWHPFTNDQGVSKLAAQVSQASIVFAAPSSVDRLHMTAEDYMLQNPTTTRLYLVHLGGWQDGMEQRYDGRSCVEHINSVLMLGAQLRMQLGILQDPSVSPDTKSPGKAVHSSFEFAVGRYGDRVKVFNAGTAHAAYGDPAFADWVDDPGTTAIVLMGFDADICAHANIFGSKQCVAETAPLDTLAPPRLVPALVSRKDVVTARPLLISTGRISRPEYGPLQNT
jgi:hypothetical protein